MEATAVKAAALAGSVSADMSIWGLFVQADFVVKAVMIGLLLASFWCWAIIFEKVRRIRRLRLQASQFEETFWSGGSLDDLFELQFVCLHTTIPMVIEITGVPGITRTFHVAFASLVVPVTTPKSQLANKFKELDLLH